MIAVIALILVVIGICYSVASSVYKKQVKAGRNPWAWTIISFFLSAAVLIFAGFALFLYAFSFER